jgi:hypothetical protein
MRAPMIKQNRLTRPKLISLPAPLPLALVRPLQSLASPPPRHAFESVTENHVHRYGVQVSAEIAAGEMAGLEAAWGA